MVVVWVIKRSAAKKKSKLIEKLNENGMVY